MAEHVVQGTRRGAQGLAYLVAGGAILGFVGLTFVLGYPVYLAAVAVPFVAGAIFLAKTPWLTFLLAVGAIFLPQVEMGPATLFQMLAALAVAGAASDLVVRRVAPSLTRLFPAYFCFAVLIVAALFHATNAPEVWKHLYLWARNYALVFLAANLVLSPERFRRVFWVMIGMGSLNAAWAVVDYVRTGDSVYRSAGFIGNQNELAGLLALCIPAAFSFLVEPGPRARRLLAAGLGLLMVGGVITSISRGGTVAFLCGALAFGILNARRWRWLVAMAVILVAMTPLIPAGFWERFANVQWQISGTVNLDNPYLTDRGYLNQAAMAMWRDHPIVGVGPGHFFLNLGMARYSPTQRQMGKGAAAHNLYFQTLSENGMLGLMVLFWIVVIALLMALRAWRWSVREGNEPVRVAASVVVAMIVTVLVMGMTASNLYQKEPHLALGLACALTLLRRTGPGGRFLDKTS